MKLHVYKLELDYPEVVIRRHTHDPMRYKSHGYRPSNASWERLIAALNRRIESTGIEFTKLMEAIIWL